MSHRETVYNGNSQKHRQHLTNSTLTINRYITSSSGSGSGSSVSSSSSSSSSSSRVVVVVVLVVVIGLCM